jgi:hypothetical protein
VAASHRAWGTIAGVTIRGVVAAGLVLPGALAALAAPRPALLSDLSDDVLAAVGRQNQGSSAAATLDAVFRATEPYVFSRAGVRAFTDTRWFQATSVEGPGAPALEVRRWPGDTILAFYELAPDGPAGSGLPPGTKLGTRRSQAGTWSCVDGKLEAPRADFDVLWCEAREGASRRIGALGIPGDAGLGEAAAPDLREGVLGVLRRTELDAEGSAVTAVPLLPELTDPPRAADERRHGWGAFAGTDYTLGLPPGLRAIRLDAGVPPPRPMPSAVAWVRGRFDDREGKPVVVGDAQRAGYVAVLEPPAETWTAGVAPPLGAARSAERADEARLDDMVREWTGASRAVVSHWKEEGFAGDWLVFRLLVGGRGIEIGLPVVSGWRSPALFWIPTTYRGAGRPPAPPPIDPAASLGVRFKRLTGTEAKRNALLEGYLVVSDLRLEVPRGWWPVANLGSRDGLPVTFIDDDGVVIGEVAKRPSGSEDLTPRVEDGWQRAAKPSSQNAAAIWSVADGRAVLVAKEGHGYLLMPHTDDPARREGWRRLRESADFIKAARH